MAAPTDEKTVKSKAWKPRHPLPVLRWLGFREVREGELGPRGFGVAWRNYHKPTTIVWVVPLNRVARWIHRAYWWLAVPKGVEADFREGWWKQRQRIDELETELAKHRFRMHLQKKTSTAWESTFSRAVEDMRRQQNEPLVQARRWGKNLPALTEGKK